MITAFAFYVITAQAVTISLHRELTHKAIRLVPWVRYTEVCLALLAVEGTIKDWVANHRQHHAFTDQDGDPHSPYAHEGILKGFVHAHMGWFLKGSKPDQIRYVPDLLKERAITVLDKLSPFVVALSFLLPGALTFTVERSWQGFFSGVFWGGFIRIFFVHHVTYSINSVCHIWGKRPYKTPDSGKSTNHALFGILGFGEGWHCNHHAFPWSARLGLSLMEVDIGWVLIKMMDKLGLVERIRVPTKNQILARQIG
jgi:stearoyl-CoA desaturase (delta-9 desaturase)